jgi:hypothetical protein
MRRGRFCRTGLRSLAIAFLAIVSLCDGSTMSLPGDFSVDAGFFPGAGLTDYKGSKPWRLRISRDGKAIQQISITVSGADVRRISKSRTLSRTDLRDLAAIVEQTNFFALPSHISNSEFDHFAACFLKITMAGRTRRVEFVWPTDEKATHKRRELTRFWKVWRTVLKLVPSPNGNSEAVSWLQHVRPDLVAQTR